jgi:hypothetical protein
MVASPDGFLRNANASIRLFRLGTIDEDAILDELNQVAENSLALLTII